MATRIGINGFGRIGRQALKAIIERYPEELEIVAINDLTDPETNAHLLAYDSTYGRFPYPVKTTEHALIVRDQPIQVTAWRDPAQIPWGDLGVEIVIESTGLFTQAEKAAAHLRTGARKVIISAPAQGEDITIVQAVNGHTYDPQNHHIISNGSCTTHCLSLTASVLSQHFGIESGFLTTIHSYTSDQRLLDQVHKDLRRARAAATNIIPTTTGAARAVAQVLPELANCFNGISLRVPTTAVCVADLVITAHKEVSVEAINAAFQEAAAGSLNGYLGYTQEPLVSADFRGDPRSAIIDGLSTMVVGNRSFKVLAWYDNEWSYAQSLANLASFIAQKGFGA